MSSDHSVRLYVGDLSDKVDETMLREAFENCAVSIRRDRDSKLSLGYAHLIVSSEEKAQDLILSMNGQVLGGNPVRVSKYDSNPRKRRSNIGNIVIRDLPKGITAAQLLPNFEQSHIYSSKIMPVRGNSLKTMAYIQFQNEELAERTIKQFKDEMMTIGGEKHQVIVQKYVAKSKRDSELQWSTVYVNGFPLSRSDDEITAHFSNIGAVDNCFVKACGLGKFALCKFSEHSDAVKCIETMNGQSESEEGVSYTWFVTKAEKGSLRKKRLTDAHKERVRTLNREQAGRNLYVYRIKESATEEEFRGWFAGIGEIESVRLPMADDDKCAGFGYVCFKNKVQAEEAIKAYNQNGEVNDGTPLFVTVFKSREERQKAKAVSEMNMRTAPQYLSPNYYQNVGYMMPPYSQQGIPHDGRHHIGGGHQPRNPMGHMAHQQNHHQQQQQPQQIRQAPVVVSEVPHQVAPVVSEAPRQPAPVDSNVMTAEQRQAMGGELFNKIKVFADESKVGKLTGMLLGLSKVEVMELLESDSKLKDKVKEAEDVLNRSPA